MPIGQCDGRPLESSKSNFPIGPHFAKNFAMRSKPGSSRGGTRVFHRGTGPRTRECKAGTRVTDSLWRERGLFYGAGFALAVCGPLFYFLPMLVHVRNHKPGREGPWPPSLQLRSSDIPRQFDDVISRPTDSRERLASALTNSHRNGNRKTKEDAVYLAHVGKHQSAEPLNRAVRENGLSVSASSSSVATDETGHMPT